MAGGGEAIDPDRVTWWQVYATVKWAVICTLQASAHLNGTTRSVELAAVGRRVCESEWDLFMALGLAAAVVEPVPAVRSPAPVVPPFGRPTAQEFVEAVEEYLERGVTDKGEAGARSSRRGSPAMSSGRSPVSWTWARPSARPTPGVWPNSGSTTTGCWPRPSGRGSSTKAGTTSVSRRPPRPGTSCWWPTPPTWMPRARRPPDPDRTSRIDRRPAR